MNDPDDDLDLYQWGAKHYGKTSFGINWPANTFAGASLNLQIALLRVFVIALYRPILKPMLRATAKWEARKHADRERQ